MNKQENKNLAEELKTKLNSPDYVAVPEILGHDDRFGSMFPFVYGRKISNSVHSEERDNWILDMNKNRKKDDGMIYEHQLEPADWEEIINLIEKRNKEKKQAFEQKWAQIQEKLNNTPGLYYYWGRSRKEQKADCWIEWKDMRGFTSFFGKENGRTHYLYIHEEHPILDNFSFEKGFYLIDTDVPIEKSSPDYWNDGGENNPHNFRKFIELENEITITPENGEKLVAKEANRKQNTPNKKAMGAAGSAKGNLTAKSKSTTPEAENNLTAVQARNSTDPADNKQLTQILQEIQQLKVKIAELEQTKTNSPQVQKLNQELQALEAQKQTLTSSQSSTENPNNSSSKLANDNNTTNQASPNSTPYLIGSLVIFGISALAIGYFLGKKRKKSS